MNYDDWKFFESQSASRLHFCKDCKKQKARRNFCSFCYNEDVKRADPVGIEIEIIDLADSDYIKIRLSDSVTGRKDRAIISKNYQSLEFRVHQLRQSLIFQAHLVRMTKRPKEKKDKKK